MKTESVCENIIVHENKIYVPAHAGDFHFWQQIQVRNAKPLATWTGGKILPGQWQSILAFFEAGYKKSDGENHVNLYYDQSNKTWTPWAAPQIPEGMHVKLPDREELRTMGKEYLLDESDKAVPVGAMLTGTVHHHCRADAFQSGTDAHDEKNMVDGLHITVGGIGTKTYSLHGRLYMRRISMGIDWNDWFDFPDEWKRVLPPALFEDAVEYVMTTPPKDVSFPSAWLDNVLEKSVGFRTAVGVNYTPYQSSFTPPGLPARNEYKTKASCASEREWDDLVAWRRELDGQFD